MSTVYVVDPAEVRRVVSLDGDPVLRNLLITQRYHELSESLRLLTGGQYVNWCTFGTWASKTAGGFIRGDEVPGAFRDLLNRSSVFGEIAHLADPVGLLGVVSRVVSDASAFLMMGNLVVFAELAGTISSFVTTFGTDQAPDAAKLQQFQATLTDGDPLPDEVQWDAERKKLTVTTKGGQGMLRRMAANYYAAMFEQDAKKRAELLLLANAQGGIHEQTRLQTYIVKSLDVAMDDTLLSHARAEVDSKGMNAIERTGAHALLETLVPALAARIRRAWEDFATVAMMKLTLPEGAIHLGRPIPSEPGVPLFPSELATIDHPELRTTLQQFNALDVAIEEPLRERALQRFETLLGFGHPLTDSLLEAAAADWATYPQRMRFIFTLFRSRGADPHLVAAPFTADQISSMAALKLPSGPL